MKDKTYWEKQFAEKANLIFDFDRTIARIELDWDGWRTEMLRVMHKFEPDFPTTESVSKNINRFIETYGNEFRDEHISANENYEVDSFDRIVINESLLEYIQENSDFKNMFLYTSNSARLIGQLIKELDLEKAFHKVVTRNDVAFIKPHPDGMSKIIDGDLSDCLMIGDSSSDSGVAEAVGMDFLLVEMDI